MPESARKTDPVATGHACDTITELDTPGQNTVYVNELLACRLGDLTVVHDILVGVVCIPHVAPITSSSSTVYIAGILAARKGDSCDAGSIIGGSPNVYIG